MTEKRNGQPNITSQVEASNPTVPKMMTEKPKLNIASEIQTVPYQCGNAASPPFSSGLLQQKPFKPMPDMKCQES